MRALLNSQLLLETIYLIAAMLFILSLKWLSSPASARRGVRAGEIGMLLAVVGTLLHHGIVDYTWIAIALVLGTVIGVPLGFRANDRRAAADCTEPRVWRIVRNASWHRGILFARACCAEIHDGGALAGNYLRFADIDRQLDGRG